MMSLARGFVYVITQGRPLLIFHARSSRSAKPASDRFLYRSSIMFAFVGLGYLLLNRTGFGRKVTALGANEQVALLTGLCSQQNQSRRLHDFGFCSAMAGVLLGVSSKLRGNLRSVPATSLDAVAAVVTRLVQAVWRLGVDLGRSDRRCHHGRDAQWPGPAERVRVLARACAAELWILLACSIDQICETLKRVGSGLVNIECVVVLCRISSVISAGG